MLRKGRAFPKVRRQSRRWPLQKRRRNRQPDHAGLVEEGIRARFLLFAPLRVGMTVGEKRVGMRVGEKTLEMTVVGHPHAPPSNL
jgi:hypothetical protein